MESSSTAEKSIYMNMLRSRGKYEWYVIRSDMETPEDKLLEPVERGCVRSATFCAPAAVGSKIYLFGGNRWEFLPLYGVRALSDPRKEVHFLDTDSPGTGWVAVPGSPMKQPRSLAHAVPINDDKQVCVFLGNNDQSRNCEIYDIERPEKSCHFDLPEDPRMGYLCSHAVTKNGKGEIVVLLLTRSGDCLFSFDVESKSHQLLANVEDLGIGDVNRITISDGILYLAGYSLRRCLMAIDLSSRPLPELAKASEIEGLLGKHLPIPNKARATNLYVVEVAKDKLALVWGQGFGFDFQVFCTRIQISKDDYDDAGKRLFKATSVTKAKYTIQGGCSLRSVLPVNKSWIQGEEEPAEHKRGQSSKNRV